MKGPYRALVTTILLICLLASFVHAEESVDYDALFERALTESNEQIANDLVDAFFADLRTFLKELAFRDAQTKQAVIDLFIGEYITAEQLPKIVSHFSTYQVILPTMTEKDSLQALKSAVVYKRDSLPGTYRDIPTLMDAVMSIGEMEGQSFSDELARAAIAEPANMIHLLAQEECQVQERILVDLWYQYYTFRGTILKEKLTAIRDTEDFTDEELALLDTIVGYYAESPTVTPPSDPDPEELKAWLEKKQPVATEPTQTDAPPTATNPTPAETEPTLIQTDPADPEPTVAPAEPEQDSNERLWITVSLCFLAGCVGLLAGVLLHQRKEA